jgi:ferredoxin
VLYILIPKSQIGSALDAMRASFRVVAPVRVESRLVFREIENSGQVEFSDALPDLSPKEYFFPQTEMFLKYDENGAPSLANEAPKTVIFGVRPCDLHALKVLAAVFTQGNYADPLFAARRKNTVIIGLGCVAEKPGCFCAEAGINREYSPDCDIFLSDRGDRYFAEILTDAGQALAGAYLSEMEKTEPARKPVPVDIQLKLNAGETELFARIDWERISETCMGCGACTFVCPTCHCFEFKDVRQEGECRRYCCWDSCMYPKFTLHASGHNPRPTKKERYRQRVLHKYLYIPANFGLTGCSGCGRCIRSCPAGMNIRSIVKGIMEELT